MNRLSALWKIVMMLLDETLIDGLYMISLNPISDERGYFMRLWDDQYFGNRGLSFDWVQESVSFSKTANTLRGLHFQYPPFSEAKFVTVLRGRILDVVVDLRLDSGSFGSVYSAELSSKNHSALLIPRGCAHGFVTKSDNCLMMYKMDAPHNPHEEDGIIWNDVNLKIDWGTVKPIISQRDSNFDTFEDVIDKIRSRSIPKNG